MILFIRYLLFFLLGVIICVIPIVRKLIKKEKYGIATFLIIIAASSAIIIIYYIVSKQYLNYL